MVSFVDPGTGQTIELNVALNLNDVLAGFTQLEQRVKEAYSRIQAASKIAIMDPGSGRAIESTFLPSLDKIKAGFDGLAIKARSIFEDIKRSASMTIMDPGSGTAISANLIPSLAAMKASMTSTMAAVSSSLGQTGGLFQGFFRLTSGGFNKLGDDFKGMIKGLGEINLATILFVGVIGAAVEKLASLSVELQRASVLIMALDGNQQIANRDMDNLIKLASQSPASLNALTEAFVRLKSAGIDPLDEKGNGPLKDLSNAIAAFGGSDNQLYRASLAIQEIMGEGNLMARQLRIQLGQSIPTAMRLMAEQMGITVSELMAKVRKGLIDSQTAVNALFPALEKYYGKIGELLSEVTLSGGVAQIKSQIDAIVLSMNRLGGFAPIVAVLHSIRDAFADLNKQIQTMKPEELTKAFDDFFNSLKGHDNQIAGIVNGIMMAGQAIMATAGAVLKIVTTLPPAILAGGIISVITFGKVPMAIGVLLAAIGPQIGALVNFLLVLYRALPSDIIGMGLIGRIVLGPEGFLIGAFAGAYKMLFEFSKNIGTALMLGAGQAITFVKNMMKGMDPGSAWDDATAKTKAWNAEIAAGQGRLDKFVASVTGLGGGFRTTAGDVGAAIDKIKKATDAFAGQMKELQGAVKPVPVLPGLSASDQAAYEKLLTETDRLKESLAQLKEGPGGREQVKLDIETAKWNLLTQAIKKKIDAEIENGNSGAVEKLREQQHQITADMNEHINTAKQVIAIDNQRWGAGQARKAQTAAQQETQLTQDLKKSLRDIQELSGKATIEWDKVFGVNEEKTVIDSVRQQFQSMFDKLDTDAAKFLEQMTKKLKLKNPLMSIGDLLKIAPNDPEVIQFVANYTQALGDLSSAEAEAARQAVVRMQAQKENMVIDEEQAANVARLQLLLRMQQNETFVSPLEIENTQKLIEKDNALFAIRQKIKKLTDDYNASAEGSQERTRLAGLIGEWQQILVAEGKYYDQITSRDFQYHLAAQELWKQTGDAIKSSLTDALVGLVTGTKTAKQALLDMYNAITRAAAEYIVKLIMIKTLQMLGNFMAPGLGNFVPSAPVFSQVANFGWAKGGAFEGGLQKFASGAAFTNSIVNGPTLFPMGMMGETGPEAIMPLSRDSSGRLGVRGGGGSDTYHIHISAVDARSVSDLFFQHGDALVNALRARGNLNGGIQRSRR